MFAFNHISKIQSIHYVKLYINRLCITNVVFDFCALPQIMFLTCGFLFPVSTMNIIAGLRSFTLGQSRGKVACAVAVKVGLYFYAVFNFWVDFWVVFIFLYLPHFWNGLFFQFVFIFGVIIIFGAVSIFWVFFLGCLPFRNCL